MAQRGTRAKIDMIELEKLCSLQCTDQELAAWFNVTTKTIERRRKVKKFAEVMERGKAKGRISVRRLQMKLLEQGNATMGVWLGKQILGQTDEIRHDGPAHLAPLTMSIPLLTQAYLQSPLEPSPPVIELRAPKAIASPGGDE